MDNNLKVITIAGDSLSMVSPEKEIFYKDTYPFKLQMMLNLTEYNIALRSNGRNNVLSQALRENLDRNVLYNNSRYIIFHLGIVDCAPRLFGLMEDRIIFFLSQMPIIKFFVNLLIKFKSKYRRFFTRYFPKTYVSRKDFKGKYEYILEEVKNKARPRKVFLINIADTNEKNKLRSFDFEKNIRDYNNILEGLVLKNRDFCELVDVFSATKENKDLMLDDGIHLSKAGHDFLAQTLYEKIKHDNN